MTTDIEIARAAKKRPIQEIGSKLGIGADHLVPFGHDKAKVSADFIKAQADKQDGKLILVTAINPLSQNVCWIVLLHHLCHCSLSCLSSRCSTL